MPIYGAAGSESGSVSLPLSIAQGGTASTSASAARTALGVIGEADRETDFVFIDDFINCSDATGGSVAGWTKTIASGLVGPKYSVSYPGRYGIVRVNSGTTLSGTNTGCISHLEVGLEAHGGMSCEWSIMTPDAASDGTTSYALYAGWGDQLTGATDQSNGIYFRYAHGTNSGKWEGKCANSGSRTAIDTGLSFVASTWYKMRFVVNAAQTSVEFFIDNVSKGTIATNIPVDGKFCCPILKIAKTAGNTEREMLADWVECRASGLTR